MRYLREDELRAVSAQLGGDGRWAYRVKRALRKLAQWAGEEPVTWILVLCEHGIPAWDYIKPEVTVYAFARQTITQSGEWMAARIGAGLRRDFLPERGMIG